MYCGTCQTVVAPMDPEKVVRNGKVFHGGCAPRETVAQRMAPVPKQFHCKVKRTHSNLQNYFRVLSGGYLN